MDGQIIETFVSSIFAASDNNNDGSLSVIEFYCVLPKFNEYVQNMSA